jgi:hypothetical protein
MMIEYDISFISRVDPTHNIVFYACWSDWEEYGWLVVSEKAGEYYSQEGGYSVMSLETFPEVWNPEPITQDEALKLML